MGFRIDNIIQQEQQFFKVSDSVSAMAAVYGILEYSAGH
jgi:hypothetical protein